MHKQMSRMLGCLAVTGALALSLAPAAYAAGEPGGGSASVADPVSAQVVEAENDGVTAPQAEGDVARIGDATYASIDEAIENAAAGSTIELLQDVTVSKTFYKSLTFTGGHKLAVDAYSWRYSGDLIFDDADFEMVVDADSPAANNGEISRWLGMALSNGSIVARNGANVTFSFDSATGTNCAIYGTNADIIVESGSTFAIYGKNTRGVTGQGLQLDSAATVGIKVTGGSTFLIDGTNRGYVCSPQINVEDSTFTVQNCTANGSNGGRLAADNSVITFQNNAGHGLSAEYVRIQNSKLVADGNGYRGISINDNGTFTVDKDSTITATANSWDGDFAGLKVRPGATATFESGAVVVINDNYCSGLSNNGKVVFDEGVDLTITGNTNKQGGASGSHGGGIYNSGSRANLTIPSDTVIYNNHALTDGDDIYNSASSTITFCQTGSGWALDGEGIDEVPDDCTDTIDGWYDDSADARWEAHADSYDGIHVEEYTYDPIATVTGPLALKAAHGLGVVAVDPADITIYMGGDEGYEGTATSGGTIAGSNSLPEPGFYFVLSADINQAFANAGIADLGEAADLSEYMTIYTHGYGGEGGELHWKLEKYGENVSEAYDKFIYRIVPNPTAGQEAVPVRLQFTGDDGASVTSDEFDPSSAGTLSKTYEMKLYTELVNNDQVVFEVDINGEKYYNSMELQTGTLNVRYVTGSQDSVMSDVLSSEDELAAARAESPDSAFALLPEGTVYYVNGSSVDIARGVAPSLLFDDVVSDHNTTGADDYDQQLANRAAEIAVSNGADFENPYYQAKYLDLVDVNNGNVWLTASKPVTVYWPYPEGTDEGTEFHLVHFSDLDRTMANGDIPGAIASSATEYVAVENTEHGIRFTTDGFSPFVLIWDAGSEAGPQPEPSPKPAGNKNDGGLAKTGDGTSFVGVAATAAAGVALVGAGVMASKRREG